MTDATSVRRREERARTVDTLAAIAVTAGLLLLMGLVLLGGRSLDLSFYGSEVDAGLAQGVVVHVFLEAAAVSLVATVVSFLLGLPLGFFVGWARTLRPAKFVPVGKRSGRARALGALSLAGRAMASRLADYYVEVVRGTPLFVQVIMLWSITLVALPAWTPSVRNLVAGIVAMTINTGGYQGEVFRGGFQAVPFGQVEAARAVGLSRWGAMRSVVLPQTLRLVIPPLTNEFVALFKGSSLLFWIGVAELTAVGKDVVFATGETFEVFLLLTGIYLLVTVPLSRSVGYLERRFRIPGLGMEESVRSRRRATSSG